MTRAAALLPSYPRHVAQGMHHHPRPEHSGPVHAVTEKRAVQRYAGDLPHRQRQHTRIDSEHKIGNVPGCKDESCQGDRRRRAGAGLEKKRLFLRVLRCSHGDAKNGVAGPVIGERNLRSRRVQCYLSQSLLSGAVQRSSEMRRVEVGVDGFSAYDEVGGGL